MLERSEVIKTNRGTADALLSEAISRFEAAWRSGLPPEIDDYLTATMPNRQSVLVELVHTDLEYRLKARLPCRVEDYRSRYPELTSDREVALGLIEAEYALRRRFDTDVDPEEYRQRFPEYSDVLPARLDRGEAAVGLPRIAGYTVLGIIGRGGMSVVYKARHETLKRLVALKMILPSLHASPEGVARFRAEAEAIARLQHPNIVQVFEVGETDGPPGTTCPYIALEYADGGSLDRMLVGTPQPPRRGADLVETLARAVQAAHDRGIIHRDLKPANVLWVGAGEQATSSADMLDGSGQPKIADFGLVKLLGSESATTHVGQLLGTPSYMAPEQAEGRNDAIDRVTDVYALGAILYELLTGRPPFLGSTVTETVEQVKSLEPLRPSQLQPRTPSDLETICLKCLEKDPGRRYPGAADLADDLRRFLDGRTITARPVTSFERAYRWGRRNPWVAGLASALVLTLLGGLAASTTQWLRAERSLIQADDRFHLALEAINSFYTGTSEDVILKEERLKELRKKLLHSPLEFYKKLAADLESNKDPGRKNQADLAEAYRRLAEITAEVGSKEDALSGYERALAIWERLFQADSTNIQYQRELALCYSGLGRLQHLTGHPDRAIQVQQRAFAILGDMTRAHPDDILLKHDQARSLINIGAAQSERQLLADALRSYQEAITILETIHGSHPDISEFADDLAKSYFNLGLLQRRGGQTDAAERSYYRSLKILEPLLKNSPGDNSLSIAQSAHNGIGIIQKSKRLFAEARLSLLRARDYCQRLSANHPTSTVHQHALAVAVVNLGAVEMELGQPLVALNTYQQARDILLALIKENPDDARARRSLAGCLTFLAASQQKSGAWDESLRTLGVARALFEGLPSTPDIQYNLACVFSQYYSIFINKQTDSIAEQKRYADLAMEALQKAVSGERRHLAMAREDPDLAPLRSREDFQALVHNQDLPVNPSK